MIRASSHLRPHTQSIAIAVALSVILHGLVLWLPEVHLPQAEETLPPLIAKLEPLPKISATVTKKTAKPKVRPKPQPVAKVQSVPQLPVIASASIAASTVEPASSPIATNTPEPASAPVIAEPSHPLEVADTQPEATRPPLPKHARLRFDVYQGERNFKVGEAVHSLEINEGHYTIKADIQTTGIVDVFKSYRLVQTSSGTATPYALKPETFSEEVTDSSGKQSHQANFDWAQKKIHYSKGNEIPLPPQTQDILSIMYQFPPKLRQDEIVTISISTGKKFEEYRFEIGFEEKIDTPIGTLHTVHFRKLRKANQEGLEIWFAQEYRFFPAKIRYLDRDGKISAEAILTDIRVAGE